MDLWLVVPLVGLAALALAGGETQGAELAREGARELPQACEADVVVVGGGTGAVAAAVAAAEEGARVFLAAPYPYLGEDLCATLRLWLEAGERPEAPLARKLFRPAQGAAFPPSLPFTYRADRPSARRHPDTDPPSRLADGRWGNPQTESVQYDGDVTVVADLGEPKPIRKAHLLVYHRSDFQVAGVDVALSQDGREWKPVATVRNPHPPQEALRAPAIPLSAAVGQRARYVRLAVRRAAGSERLLLGEIVLEGPGEAEGGPHSLVAPLHVKRTLDEALLDAGVRFLFGCLPTDVLRDAEGRVCGIAMANRAGRQAVVARTVVDATEGAWVARMAGADLRSLGGGPVTVRRVVIGGQPRPAEGLAVRRTGLRFPAGKGGRGGELVEFTLRLPLRERTFGAFAELEQRARDLTEAEDRLRGAEALAWAPPWRLVGAASAEGEWPGPEALPLDAFRPRGLRRLLVLGPCADLPSEHAARLLRPLARMALGRRIGAAAAAEARGLPEPREPALRSGPAKGEALGEVREPLGGPRPVSEGPGVPQEARGVPVLGAWDVVVVGGGTSGAPAAIAAARQGCRVLVVECQHGLGGVGTLGLIGRYHQGYRGGFTAEVDRGVGASGRGWDVERKMAWWRRALREAGGDIWFGCIGCGALVREGRVRGAVVATPWGRGVALAEVVIDATGNADVAAAAGAPCATTDASRVAVQGTGLPRRPLGADYVNTDFTITDETDLVDVWQLLVAARKHYRGFDVGTLVDTRERRRVVGDFTLSILDVLTARTYPDTIAQAVSNLDTHGYTIAPVLTLRHPGRTHCFVPYRCLLPRGLGGLLVVGLGISAHRDAMPFVRMQADLQNLGYAAGLAAAQAVHAGVGTREIDVRALQRKLVALGNLPEEVLGHEDSHPLPPEALARAVATLPRGYRGAAVLLAHPRRAVPLLRRAYRQSDGEAARLATAHVLAVLGDADGLETLIGAVQAAPDLGDGYRYRGMGHDHSRRRMSQVDSLITALGLAGDRRAVPAILAKLELLGPDAPFSHHYAVATALERLGAPEAARPLAELLARPGMSGHAIHTLEQAMAVEAPPLGNESRRRSFREVVLARALLRCGDPQGMARDILESYRKDLRGHFARHAAALLAARAGE
ncbi:MAG: FAD-dependent oxidoreductase [Candidatus Brocadiia bacterium]